jgi:hypothetical protein
MMSNIELRDYLAGQAVAGAAHHQRLNDGNKKTRQEHAARIAEAAYEIADALIHQRGQGPTATPAG